MIAASPDQHELKTVSWLISSLMLYAYWFDQPEVPVQYINELKDFCCDNSMPDHICGVLLCLAAAPFQELQGKMQETHSKCSWNNLCIGRSSTLFASGSFLLKFVGVCIPSEKEYFGFYLLWMSSTSQGDAFFKFAWNKTVSLVSPAGKVCENKTPPDKT